MKASRAQARLGALELDDAVQASSDCTRGIMGMIYSRPPFPPFSKQCANVLQRQPRRSRQKKTHCDPLVPFRVTRLRAVRDRHERLLLKWLGSHPHHAGVKVSISPRAFKH